MDSGAVISLIHEKMLEYCDYETTGTRTKEYLGAGGSTLDLLPYMVDLSVDVKGLGMVVFRKVLVLRKEAKVTRTLLVGRTDLQRLKVEINFATNTVTMGTGNQRKSIRMKEKSTKSVAKVNTEKDHKQRMKSIERKMDRIFEGFDINMVKARKKKREDPEGLQQSHTIESDRVSTEAVCGEPCMYTQVCCKGCEQCVDTAVQKWLQANEKAPDIEGKEGDEIGVTLNRYIERLRQRSRATYTHDECTIDENFAKEHPKIAKEIKKIINEYKDVFATDIGKVGDEYTADANITGKMSPTRPGHQQFQGTTLVAILKQFAKQIADGVLVDVQKAGIIPKNYLQVLPIKKKDDDGKILEVLSSLRVVVDSTPVNGQTDYKLGQTDNLNDNVDFAARTSKKGFNLKADIGDAFYTIPLKKDKWGYFCINIPFLGTYCYTRIVQGWGPSAQICQEVFARIFFELREYMRRYMDDLILATVKDGDAYLKLIRKFFKIVRRNNLRLKGKKCFFGSKAFNFLGYVIENGRITASPHYMAKLENMSFESILTKTQLRSFVMSFAFLARFLSRSSELLKPLRDVMSGNGKDRITWTEPLINAYGRVQKALRELVKLYPFDPELQTVMVVDTSKEATGGFIYQVHESGPRLISFFSRTRKDKERKITLSSCHIELLGLKVMTLAFIPILRQAKKTIIAVTDNAPTVQIWNKFRKHEMPSHDTRINNALYMLASSIDLNIVHAKNTNDKLQFADMLSRLKIIRESKPCEGQPKCPICKAADLDNLDSPTIINAIEEMTAIEKNIGDILVDSNEDGVNLIPDEWAFKPWRFREEETIQSVRMDKPWTLRELLESPAELRRIQSESKDLRTLRKGLENGRHSFPKKLQRLHTMLETRNATLKEGVIYMDKTTGGVTRQIIPIPDKHAMKIIAAVHRTVGHGPVTQTVRQVQRYFEIAKPKEKVEKLLKQCVKCALLKGGSNYKKQLKAVPIPSDMFRSVLADEITRTIRGKSLKMLIAMEAASGFMMVVVYEGAMSGEKFIAAMGYVKAVLCPHNMGNLKIELRCDQAPWHTGSLVIQGLAIMGIDLRVHDSKTISKNIIPELDVKIKNYSQHLIQLVEDTPASFGLGLPCHLAAAKCNNTIGSSGYTPAEIFVGRGWKDNETIQIDVKDILEKVNIRRKKRREYEDRKRLKGQQRKELNLVPYDDPTLNSELVNNPNLVAIKEGDRVTLKLNFDKNEPKSPYIVVKVNFRKRQALLKRDSGLDSGAPEPRWICFSRIDNVFPKEDHFHQNLIASICNEYNSENEEEKEEEEELYHSNKFRKFMAMAGGQIISMYAAPKESTWDTLDSEGFEYLTCESERLDFPVPTVRPPGGVVLTSDGPRMEGTPSDHRKWLSRISGFTGLLSQNATPGGTTPGNNSFRVDSPALSASPISESDYEIVTHESLEDSKREHPASALHRLTVIRKTPEVKSEVKPEVKPKITPEQRKEVIRNRLKSKLERKSAEKFLTPKTEPEIKIEPDSPKFKSKTKMVSKIPVAKGFAKNKRIEDLKRGSENSATQSKFGVTKPKNDQVRKEKDKKKTEKAKLKSEKRKKYIELDESPVRPRPKSTRKAAKTGQGEGAFSGKGYF